MFYVAGKGPDPSARPTLEDVTRRTMSPFCPGLTVDECPSSQAQELRTRIAQQIAARRTNQQIDSWLVENYGERVLARPRATVSWLIPLALFALAGLLLLLKLPVARVSTRELVAPDTDAERPVITESERARFERDLARFKEATE